MKGNEEEHLVLALKQ